MFNMDQKKLVEVINALVVNKYSSNILSIQCRVIKLFTAMPYTGAPNVSDAMNIALIQDLEKFISANCRISSN